LRHTCFGLIIVFLLISGCIRRYPAILPSTNTSVVLSRNDYNILSAQRVEGVSAWRYILGIITEGEDGIEKAYNDALEKTPGANSLIDVRVDYEVKESIFYSERITHISGIPIRIKPSDADLSEKAKIEKRTGQEKETLGHQQSILSLKTVDSNSKPIGYVPVIFYRNNTVMHRTTTNDVGEVMVLDIPIGSYTLTASKGKLTSAMDIKINPDLATIETMVLK
jgi:hypothetical protein